MAGWGGQGVRKSSAPGQSHAIRFTVPCGPDGISVGPLLGSHCSDIDLGSPPLPTPREPRSPSVVGVQPRELGPQPATAVLFLDHPGGFSRCAVPGNPGRWRLGTVALAVSRPCDVVAPHDQQRGVLQDLNVPAAVVGYR